MNDWLNANFLMTSPRRLPYSADRSLPFVSFVLTCGLFMRNLVKQSLKKVGVTKIVWYFLRRVRKLCRVSSYHEHVYHMLCSIVQTLTGTFIFWKCLECHCHSAPKYSDCHGCQHGCILFVFSCHFMFCPESFISLIMNSFVLCNPSATPLLTHVFLFRATQRALVNDD